MASMLTGRRGVAALAHRFARSPSSLSLARGTSSLNRAVAAVDLYNPNAHRVPTTSTQDILKPIISDRDLNKVMEANPLHQTWWTGKKPSECPGWRADASYLTSLPLVNCETATRKEMLNYFDNTWTLTEQLFSALQDEASFYLKPYHKLRHPLVFYYGHPAAFYINKLRLAGIHPEPINDHFERSLFEVGECTCMRMWAVRYVDPCDGPSACTSTCAGGDSRIAYTCETRRQHVTTVIPCTCAHAHTMRSCIYHAHMQTCKHAQVGVDEMSWDDLSQTVVEWPSVHEVKEYRRKVYATVRHVIESHPALEDGHARIGPTSPLWSLVMSMVMRADGTQRSLVLIPTRRLQALRTVDDSGSPPPDDH